jgi:hypothetical protein
MKAPMVDSFIVKSPKEFNAWCEKRFASADKVWIVKDVGGTGGEDIWLFNKSSWEGVAKKLEAGRTYVIQHYISNPLLWEGGYKFHFRVYAILTGDMQLFVYRKSFAHVANKPFTCECDSNGFFDNEIHITNVSQNIHDAKKFHAYPIVDMPDDYPKVFEGMRTMLADLIRVSSPYMHHQSRASNIAHIGFDIIADQNDGVWLIEANCPPNMFAYKGALLVCLYCPSLACTCRPSLACTYCPSLASVVQGRTFWIIQTS